MPGTLCGCIITAWRDLVLSSTHINIFTQAMMARQQGAACNSALASRIATCLAVLLMMHTQHPAEAAAASSVDPTTGIIMPPSAGPPDFNPADWNRAYKLTIKGVPSSQSSKELKQWLGYPQASMVNVQTPQDCSRQGFNSVAAASAPLVSVVCIGQKTRDREQSVCAQSNARPELQG